MIRIHHYVHHHNFLWRSISWYFLAAAAITSSMEVDPKLWANADKIPPAEKLFEAHPSTTIKSSPAQFEPEWAASQCAPHSLNRPSLFSSMTSIPTFLQHESDETHGSAKKQKCNHEKVSITSPDVILQPSASHARVGLNCCELNCFS
jgi:hypothetical protein